MDVTTQKGQELLDYIDNLAELAGDGERAVAFTTAWRAIRARLPFIEREAAAATPSLDVDALAAALRFHFEDHTAGEPGDHSQCTGDIAARYARLARLDEGSATQDQGKGEPR